MPQPLTFSKAEEIALLDNSIERVINTSIRVASVLEAHIEHPLSEDGSINRQDWEELKPLVRKLWNHAAETIREQRYNASR